MLSLSKHLHASGKHFFNGLLGAEAIVLQLEGLALLSPHK